MSRKLVIIMVCALSFLLGCSKPQTVTQTSEEEQAQPVATGGDYSYYQRTDEVYDNAADRPITVTTETLFGCPFEADEDFGCFEIIYHGLTGELTNNGGSTYTGPERKDWQKDKCFGILTNKDTGEKYYWLAKRSSDLDYMTVDMNQTYIVVPQEVFDRLTEDWHPVGE